MRRSILVIAALAGLTAAGCQQQTDLTERMEQTEELICQQLGGVGTALEQVAALEPTSTVGEAQAADAALGTAISSLEDSEQKLDKLRLEEFQTQLKTFKGEVAKVAADEKMTIEQAAAELKDKAQPVITARKQLSASVNCPEMAEAPEQP